jgi:ABC-2 type transport system ATP-binding protein
VAGRPYRSLRRPLFEVGAMLESAAVHPGRSARAHLLALAQANGIGRRRVDHVLDIVGLDGVATRRAGQFSLGMTQRLGLAAALLGDPGVLLLDEPVNGLDPEGVAWIRTLLRSLAAEGRTVFVSSHLMTEMALTADHLIVIGRGRLLADTSVAEFVRATAAGHVRVRTPQPERLAALLREHGATVESTEDGALAVTGMDAATVGELAAGSGVVLHELVTREPSLEEAFMTMTSGAVDYQPQPTTTAAR